MAQYYFQKLRNRSKATAEGKRGIDRLTLSGVLWWVPSKLDPERCVCYPKGLAFRFVIPSFAFVEKGITLSELWIRGFCHL